jgi:predicted metal-dependent enzyme (double-stranded beta helix superfamily)
MAERDCARAIVDAIDRHGGDTERLGAEIRSALTALVAQPDLLARGIPRAGNNVAFSQYLYFDGSLSILIYEVPKGQPIQAHDHGIWEALTVYRGRIHHVVYERIDDGAVPGVADLRVNDDRILNPGDFAIVAPPADIHSFAALDDGTYGITAVSGAYKSERHYYDPERKTCVVRAGPNPR